MIESSNSLADNQKLDLLFSPESMEDHRQRIESIAQCEPEQSEPEPAENSENQLSFF